MNIQPEGFYCYLSGSWLRALFEDDPVLDALIEVLRVPGKPAQLKRQPLSEKRTLIEEQIDSLRRVRSSPWYQIEAAEVLAANLFIAKMSAAARSTLFSGVKREADLTAPVVQWIRDVKGLQPHVEVATGTKRPDVVGYRPQGWISSQKVVAVELKNDLEQLKHGWDQMTTFAAYSHEVYLACTPRLAAEYLHKHANAPTVRRWDPFALDHKLERCGFGFLLVAGPAIGTHVLRKPKAQSPKAEKIQELLGTLNARSGDAKSRKQK